MIISTGCQNRSHDNFLKENTTKLLSKKYHTPTEGGSKGRVLLGITRKPVVALPLPVVQVRVCRIETLKRLSSAILLTVLLIRR